jgi:tetratricopeptide (TPR) repeat protein
MSKRIVCLIVVSSIFFSIYAQDLKKNQESFLEAEYFFVYKDYTDALPYYLKLYEIMPENTNLAYRIGLCYLNIPGQKNLAISYLETASMNATGRHKEGTINQLTAPYESWVSLADAYRVNFQFDKAKVAYQRYQVTLFPGDPDFDFIEQQIKSCDEAVELIKKPVEFTEENLGELFNDEKSNFNPVISGDGRSFAYMITLKFYDAIMFTRLIDGTWTPPINITPDIQSDGDFYISCLSYDGRTLFLSKDDDFNSDIFSSKYDGTKWSAAVKLNKNINTKYWESHGSISDDGNSLIFASDRPGGSGGLDLYISRKVNGDWGVAVNLGTEINTPFNEDRPFFINNGKTLYFSSQGHINMGGFDLFRSDMLSNGLWSLPVNLRYPLNTPDDNLFFMPVNNGKSGYISLFKESDNFGKEDIYKITFK